MHRFLDFQAEHLSNDSGLVLQTYLHIVFLAPDIACFVLSSARRVRKTGSRFYSCWFQALQLHIAPLPWRHFQSPDSPATGCLAQSQAARQPAAGLLLAFIRFLSPPFRPRCNVVISVRVIILASGCEEPTA
jgi:hypothetical protein